MSWNCIGCNGIIDPSEDNLAVCKTCLESNKDVLDITEKPIQFKKEFHALFYSDTFEHWYVSVVEFDFFNRRWGMN